MSEQRNVGTAPPAICSACGAQNDPTSRFCRNCGAALTANQARDQPAASDATWVVSPQQEAYQQQPYQQQPYQPGAYHQGPYQPPNNPPYLPAATRPARRWIFAGVGLVLLLGIILLAVLTQGSQASIVGTWEETQPALLEPETRLRFGDDSMLYLNEFPFARYQVLDEQRLSLDIEGEAVETEYDLSGNRLQLTIEGDTLLLKRVAD